MNELLFNVKGGKRMPRRSREEDPVDMTNLIHYIQDFIRTQQRTKPRYSQAELARQSKLRESVLSELMNNPNREPSGRTLVRLANGLGIDPIELFHIAYPSDILAEYVPPEHDDKAAQQRAARIRQRNARLLEVNPRFSEVIALLEKLPPDKQGRVQGFVEGLVAELKNPSESQS
jgi:transcriptional regulator with XRE-family HTH domain